MRKKKAFPSSIYTKYYKEVNFCDIFINIEGNGVKNVSFGVIYKENKEKKYGLVRITRRAR